MHLDTSLFILILSQPVTFAGDAGTLSPGNLKWLTGNLLDQPHITNTGSFIMNVIFHILSKDIKEAPCELKLVAKLRYIYDILIFNGFNWYRWVFNLTFYSPSNSIKIWKIEEIHLKNLYFWLIKGILLPFPPILSVRAIILHETPQCTLHLAVLLNNL